MRKLVLMAGAVLAAGMLLVSCDKDNGGDNEKTLAQSVSGIYQINMTLIEEQPAEAPAAEGDPEIPTIMHGKLKLSAVGSKEDVVKFELIDFKIGTASIPVTADEVTVTGEIGNVAIDYDGKINAGFGGMTLAVDGNVVGTIKERTKAASIDDMYKLDMTVNVTIPGSAGNQNMTIRLDNEPAE